MKHFFPLMLFSFMQPLFECFATELNFEFAQPQNVKHLKWVKIVQKCHVRALTIVIIMLVRVVDLNQAWLF